MTNERESNDKSCGDCQIDYADSIVLHLLDVSNNISLHNA